MKILAALGIVSLKTAGMLLNIIAKIVSFLAGPFLVFVIGCGIYCFATANWKSLMILLLIGVAIVAIYLAFGFLLGLIDIGYGSCRNRFKKIR